MAKVETIKFSREGKTGDTFEYSADVHVQVGGTFTIPVDAKLIPTIRARLEKGCSCGKCDKLDTSKIKIIFSHGKDRVECTELKQGLAFIDDCIDEYLTCESHTERVILYGYRMGLAYCKDGTTIFPNGASPGCDYSAIKGNPWHGELNSNVRAPMYSISLVARVYDKTTHTRASTVKVTWEEVPDENNTQTTKPVSLLNSFRGVDVDPESKSLREMPYSDKAALFFYQLMMGLCQMADRIETFFKDEKNVAAAIESHKPLLLGD